MTSPAFRPFNAPPVPEVEHDRRLVRRYLLQSALRFNAGSLLFVSLAVALLPLGFREFNPYTVVGVVLG